MVDFLLIAIGIIAGFLLFFKIPIIKKPKTIDVGNDRKTLKISIIIPCRNEEKNIAELLDALAEQTYPIHEIICVDDLSEDKTAEIISQKNARLIRITDHPEDWIGKTYAVQTGANAASGEILLFFDADLKLGSDAIETLAAAYTKHGTLSVQPYHKMKKLSEQLALFFNLTAVAGTGCALPITRTRGLFGPVIMINKDVYFNAGGHSAVKNCVVEDFMLGIHCKKSNIAYKLFVGGKNIAFRMYPNGIKEQFEGFAKNISTGILSVEFLTAVLTFAWVTAAASAPIQLIKNIAMGAGVGIAVSAALTAMVMAQIIVYSSRIGNYKPYLIPLYVLAWIWFLIVIVYSFVRKVIFRSVKWKNRKIKI